MSHFAGAAYLLIGSLRTPSLAGLPNAATLASSCFFRLRFSGTCRRSQQVLVPSGKTPSARQFRDRQHNIWSIHSAPLCRSSTCTPSLESDSLPLGTRPGGRLI